MSPNTVRWQQLINDFNEVECKIAEIEGRVLNKGNLLLTNARYRELIVKRDSLVRCMGLEFPKLWESIHIKAVSFPEKPEPRLKAR